MTAALGLATTGLRSAESEPGPPPEPVPGPAPNPADRAGTEFVNRRAEIDRILGALKDPAGTRFWLIVAPPGLGKSDFLRRVSSELNADDPGRQVRFVDLRDLPGPASEGEPGSLVARFFGQELSDQATSGVAERVAQAVLDSGKSYVCLLDSAELLSERAAAEFRRSFSDIYQATSPAPGSALGPAGPSRVALVVASRLDTGWIGTIPAPRFKLLSLAALGVDDIGAALSSLARRTGEKLNTTQLRQATASLAGLSSGLPELVTSCLQWVAKGHWLQLESLGNQGSSRACASVLCATGCSRRRACCR